MPDDHLCTLRDCPLCAIGLEPIKDNAGIWHVTWGEEFQLTPGDGAQPRRLTLRERYANWRWAMRDRLVVALLHLGDRLEAWGDRLRGFAYRLDDMGDD